MQGLARKVPLSSPAIARARRLLADAKKIVADAEAALHEADGGTPGKREYRCGLCNQNGHRASVCPAPRVLFRCLVIKDGGCDAMIWERDRAIHLHERHGIRVGIGKFSDYFEECENTAKPEGE